MGTNPVLGFLKTLWLFLSGRVVLLKHDIGKNITMEDGHKFRIFRHVRIRSTSQDRPQGAFIVRFKPENIGIEENIRFSRLPMMIFMGFHGFREKYWCVDDETGLCQGVYAWQTLEDASNYSRSIAMRFMTRRSVPGSVTWQVIDQSTTPYWLFAGEPIVELAK
ncbi:MAG: hypothetical protein P8074_24550 [Anaerolineales bacterium]